MRNYEGRVVCCVCVCVGLRVENKRIGDKLVEMCLLVVEARGVVMARFLWL